MAKKKMPIRIFHVLWVHDGKAEIEEINGETAWLSEKAAYDALIERETNLPDDELRTRAIECGDEPWTFYIAECVRPVSITYETNISVKVK